MAITIHYQPCVTDALQFKVYTLYASLSVLVDFPATSQNRNLERMPGATVLKKCVRGNSGVRFVILYTPLQLAGRKYHTGTGTVATMHN